MMQYKTLADRRRVQLQSPAKVNRRVLEGITEDFMSIHAKIGELNLPRDTKQELYQKLGEFTDATTRLHKDSRDENATR
ncbi:MAG: hypothetical protein V3U75_13455 [Methylococcaceae bacterium]